MRRRWMRLALAGVAVLTATGVASAAFRDVSGHWANSVVSLLEAKGLVSGDEAARFRPDAPLSRGQLAKLLVSGLGHESDAAQLQGAPSRFSDLPAAHWAASWVEALAELGLTDGYPDGTFQPDATLTRAEAAVLLARALGLPAQEYALGVGLSFADASAIPSWALRPVQVAVAAGLLQGDDSGNFRPGAPLTRAEGSVILYRLMNMQGRLINLSGTLVDWSPATRTGTVRDALGHERSFELTAEASLFQAGRITSWAGVRRLDQVWVLLGPDGKGRYLEARYTDLVGQSALLTGRTLTLQVGGLAKQFVVQPGAVIHVNGVPAPLESVDGANLAYLIMDWMTGEVRAIDAVRSNVQGALVEVIGGGPGFVLEAGGQVSFYQLSANTKPFLLGVGRVDLTSLPVDSRLYLQADETGLVRYLFAQR